MTVLSMSVPECEHECVSMSVSLLVSVHELVYLLEWPDLRVWVSGVKVFIFKTFHSNLNPDIIQLS